MIPLMALMIGVYIVTRMIVLLVRNDNRDTKTGKIIIKIFALATFFLTIICVTMIFILGSEFLEIKDVLG